MLKQRRKIYQIFVKFAVHLDENAHFRRSCAGLERGAEIHTPVRSKAGVYSSRALLFCCIKPLVRPLSTA